MPVSPGISGFPPACLRACRAIDPHQAGPLHSAASERVAQVVEHVTFNHGVEGSSPSALTKCIKYLVQSLSNFPASRPKPLHGSESHDANRARMECYSGPGR